VLAAPYFAVAVAKVPIHTSASLHVFGVVASSENETTHDSKVRLDDVEPGGFGWSPDGMDAEFLEQSEEAWIVVSSAQIVQDDEEPLVRIALSESVKGVE
jgi:hypothetical protein